MCSEQGTVDGRCRSELRDTRATLIQDYSISPAIVYECQELIDTECKHGLVKGGKTLHCLFNLMRKNKYQADEGCKNAVNSAIEYA